MAELGAVLRALPWSPSSTWSSGHLTSCNDQQILLIIKINQTEHGWSPRRRWHSKVASVFDFDCFQFVNLSFSYKRRS